MAKDLWKKLEYKYMTKSIESRLCLKKKLKVYMYKHLNDYNKILADLQNLDAKMVDEHLITTLLYGKEKINCNDVSNVLLKNEYRKKNKQIHIDTSSEAYTTRGRSKKRYPSKNKGEISIKITWSTSQ